MWFLFWLPVLTLAHISFTPALLPKELHDFTLKVVWKPLLDAKEAIPWALKLAEQISPLALATSLHFTMAKDERLRQDFLAELISKPECAFEVVEKMPDLQFSVSTLTVEHSATLATLSPIQLMALNKLMTCADSRYMQLLWDRCKDELIASADLGMVKQTGSELMDSILLNLTPGQTNILALYHGASWLEEQADRAFVRSLLRWSPLAGDLGIEHFLIMLLTHISPDAIENVPRTIIPVIFRPQLVLNAVSKGGKKSLHIGYLKILADYALGSPKFWTKLARSSSGNVNFANEDWRAFLGSISSEQSKRNIKRHYLPTMLNEDSSRLVPFLRKNCQVGPDSLVDCLVKRKYLAEYPDNDALKIFDEESETLDRESFKSSLLAYRLLFPLKGLTFDLLRKALLLDLGSFLPFSLMSSAKYPVEIETQLFPKIEERLLSAMPIGIWQWSALFKEMETWLPSFVPYFLANNPTFFFSQPSEGAEFKPSEAAISMDVATLGYLLHHGKEQIRQIPSLRLPLWFKLISSMPERGIRPNSSYDPDFGKATPLVAINVLAPLREKDVSIDRLSAFNFLLGQVLPFIQQYDPRPNYAQDYGFLLIFKREDFRSQITDPIVLEILDAIPFPSI